MENLKVIENYKLVEKNKIIYKWKLEEFLSAIRVYSNAKGSKSFQSNFSIDIPGNAYRYWYLDCNFNSTESENVGWISISVRFSSNYCSQINAEYSLYILDSKNKQQFIQKSNRVFKKDEKWLIPKFIEINELLEKKDELLPYNQLTIVIELTEFIERPEKIIVVPTKTSKHQLLNDLKDLFESKAGSDVVLLVGDKKFPAHKLILATRSPVFAAMFSHQLKENKENEIAIPDMDPEVCEKMLEYIYTENVTGLDGIAELLYEEADKYQLPALKELCEESFCKGVKVENSIKYLVLMDRHQADKRFFEYVLSFIAINSKKIVETADYKALEKTNPELSLTILTKIFSLK